VGGVYDDNGNKEEEEDPHSDGGAIQVASSCPIA
jgi:hypothetical protein